MKFSGVNTIDRSDVHAYSQGQRSKVKVTEVKTQFSSFWTITLVWIHIWWWNDGALMSFKVIRLISRSHGTKNHQFWPELGISGLQHQFEFTDGYEVMHKAWRSVEEVPYCFLRSSIKFQDHMGHKIDDLNPTWVILQGRSQLSNPSDWPCFFFSCDQAAL